MRRMWICSLSVLLLCGVLLFASPARAAKLVGSGYDLEWTLDESGTLIVSGTGDIPSGCFQWMTQIERVILDEGITGIGSSAFEGCSALREIVIPNSVTWIGANAFYYCNSLREITIPESVQSLGVAAFQGSGLQSITIPSSITEIPRICFSGCNDLSTVILSDGVTYIDEKAFFACDVLQCVTIPSTVERIGVWAFGSCFALHHILFTGTQAQWDAIEVVFSFPSENDITIHTECQGDEFADGVCTICFKNCPHTWDSGVITVAPGCDHFGEIQYTCVICHTTATEVLSELLEHSFDGGTILAEPTCTREGQICYTCTVCGLQSVANLAKTPHTPADSVADSSLQTCSVCGAVIEQIPAATEPTDTSAAEQSRSDAAIWIVFILVAAGVCLYLIWRKEDAPIQA